jgi:ribosomal protein S18 acetylase RimI-like enzyme
MSAEIAVGLDDPLQGTPDADILDNAIWASLTGPHRHFAEVRGQAARYPLDVSPFVAIAPDPDERVWDDLASLVGPGGVVPLAGATSPPPVEWEVVGRGEGVQMVGINLHVEEDPEIVELTPHDVPEMLDLVSRTEPGPFLPRTIELGHYLGIRHNGALVAMAGERLHPPRWTEISAVCTDDAYRGQGLATRLVRAVGAGIRHRGETPFLHAAATNTNAIRLYQQLGFVLRRQLIFQVLRIDASSAPA